MQTIFRLSKSLFFRNIHVTCEKNKDLQSLQLTQTFLYSVGWYQLCDFVTKYKVQQCNHEKQQKVWELFVT